MYCRNCGKRMESNDDFCMDCKAALFDKMTLTSEEIAALLAEKEAAPSVASAAQVPPVQQAPQAQPYTQAPPAAQQPYTQAAYTQVPPMQQTYTQAPPVQQAPPAQQVPFTTQIPSGGYVQWVTPTPVFGPMTGFGTALASAILGFLAFIFSIALLAADGSTESAILFLPCAIVSLVLGLKTLISVVRLRKKTGYMPKLALAFSIVGISLSGVSFMITGVLLLIVLLILAAFAA